MGACCHWCAGRDHIGVDCPTRGTYTRPPIDPETVEKIVEGAMAAARRQALNECTTEAARRSLARHNVGRNDAGDALESLAQWAREKAASAAWVGE